MNQYLTFLVFDQELLTGTVPVNNSVLNINLHFYKLLSYYQLVSYKTHVCNVKSIYYDLVLVPLYNECFLKIEFCITKKPYLTVFSIKNCIIKIVGAVVQQQNFKFVEIVCKC